MFISFTVTITIKPVTYAIIENESANTTIYQHDKKTLDSTSVSALSIALLLDIGYFDSKTKILAA